MATVEEVAMRVLGKPLILGVVTAGLLGCVSQRSDDFHHLALLNELSDVERQELMLPFDSYIVGIEKDNASRVGRVQECASGALTNCVNIDAPYFTQRPELRENLRSKYFGQFRPTFISHIVRFRDGAPPCYLLNAYDGSLPCESGGGKGESATVAGSWQALESLGQALKRQFEEQSPTHVIVYVMGWNTKQREAIQNFRDLFGQLTAAAKTQPEGKGFRPLMIGVTWPSTGSPTIPATDFGIKAKDADEVGALWVNALLHRELRALKNAFGFKVVLVGHSFGARVASRAAFSGPLVSTESGAVVDLLLGIQGAFSYQRFLVANDSGDPEGNEGAPYRDFAGAAGTVALTASSFDTAVTAALHGAYFVGSIEAYRRSKAGPHADLFNHVRVTVDGSIENLVCGPQRILMIDASEIIKVPKPGTGGGAHSGVYTPEVGRLTFELTSRCAP
jgi:pimeloyl-ACP methyl ester carboxylesterase